MSSPCCGYEFRNWRGALFPLIGVGMTIAMTLGLMGFSEFKLTTMMVLTPMLLLAIGIGHSVQVTRRFMLEHGKSGNCNSAVRVTIGHTIIPATLSIVTDMVGFATLATVDISFYKAYAYFGMFGMLTDSDNDHPDPAIDGLSPSMGMMQAKEGHNLGKGGVDHLQADHRPGQMVPIGAVVLSWRSRCTTRICSTGRGSLSTMPD